MAKCSAAKELVSAYIASVAVAAHMAAVPGAFVELKKAMEARLEVIAAPLEKLHADKALESRLGALGAPPIRAFREPAL